MTTINITELEYEAALKERVEDYEDLLYEVGYYDPDPCEKQFMEAERYARADY